MNAFIRATSEWLRLSSSESTMIHTLRVCIAASLLPRSANPSVKYSPASARRAVDAVCGGLSPCSSQAEIGPPVPGCCGRRRSNRSTARDDARAGCQVVMEPVTKVIVCDPRRNALLKAGNKNDRVDARKLSDLLRAGLLTPVYHGGSGLHTLRELGRSYLTISKDLTRVMNRLKGLYRSRAIPCAGRKVYSPRHRASWLEQLTESGVRRRAEWLYQQLDTLMQLRREARQELLAESQKHPASELLRKIPRLGPIRAALLIALLQTPHRFRTKRQLWAYCGLGVQTRASGEYQFKGGQLHRSRPPTVRGLNVNHNH